MILSLARLTTTAALAAAALGVAAPPSAAASPVTYAFAGTVDADEADRGWTTFSGHFTFDATTPDGIADPSTGAYAHAGAPWGLTLSFFIGATLVQTLGFTTAFNVLVSNDLGGEDQLGLLAQGADPADTVSMTLFDFGATAFASDALPLPAGGLTLAMFSWSQLRHDSAAGALTGRLDALACTLGCTPAGNPPPAVPEPGTGALLLAGLGAMTLLQRRRHGD